MGDVIGTILGERYGVVYSGRVRSRLASTSWVISFDFGFRLRSETEIRREADRTGETESSVHLSASSRRNIRAKGDIGL